MKRQRRGRRLAEATKVRLAESFGPPVLRALCGTGRWRWALDQDTASHFAAGGRVIYALWHEHLLPLAYSHRGLGVHVLVSRNLDGELISRVVEALGLETVRGSSSSGGTAALRRLVAAARAGCSLAVTPDGPRGPRRVVGDGVLVLAALTGLPIVPIAASASPCWRLASWDRFLVPRPFARLSVVLGPPLSVPRELTGDLETPRRVLTRSLGAACAAACAATGELDA